jgi:hypothetical protein
MPDSGDWWPPASNWDSADGKNGEEMTEGRNSEKNNVLNSQFVNLPNLNLTQPAMSNTDIHRH